MNDEIHHEVEVFAEGTFLLECSGRESIKHVRGQKDTVENNCVGGPIVVHQDQDRPEEQEPHQGDRIWDVQNVPELHVIDQESS